MSAAFSTVRPIRLRSVVCAVTAALALSLSVPGLTGAAHAAVSQSPATTYQTDGRVSAMVRVGNTLYIGGRFDSLRPAGAPAGTDEIPRAGLAAFDLSAGTVLPWNPSVNHQVNALAASPNGRVIYVGGRFGRVRAQQRSNLAAVRATGFGTVTKFRADANARVLSIVTSGKTVYVGGKLTRVSGRNVGHLAALTTRGHVRRAFHGSADGFVRSIAVGPRGRTLFLGGEFHHVDGKHQFHLAKLTRKNGHVQTLRSNPAYPVTHVVVRRHRVYLAGNGVGGHAASYTTAGKRLWVRQIDGNATSVAVIRTTLYVGGQFHNICVGNSNDGGRGFTCPTVRAARNRLMGLSKANGTLRSWDPGANSILGVFALLGTSSSLHVGGEFTTLGSVDQEGYGRFDLP
jgi:hypothetical protein